MPTRRPLANDRSRPKAQPKVAPELHLSRVFNAPKHLVFEAWSKAEYVSAWFTPLPMTPPSCEVDLRKGGVFRLVMMMPDGMEHPMDARFTEVVPNERIAFKAKLAGGTVILTEVTFAERVGKTTMKVHQSYSHESEATRGAKAGWTATLNQFAKHLRTRVRETAKGARRSLPGVPTTLLDSRASPIVGALAAPRSLE